MPSTTTTQPVDYAFLSQVYYDLSTKINMEISDPSYNNSTDDFLMMQDYANKCGQIGSAFHDMYVRSIIQDLRVPIDELKSAVDESAQTIKNMQLVGKVIEVITDLIVIGGTIAFAASKPVYFLALPKVLKELINDVQAL